VSTRDRPLYAVLIDADNIPADHAEAILKEITAIPLILRAMDKVNSDDDWCPMGPIGQYIMADNPDFDTRTYGEVKLSDLIKKLKRFETRKEGNQLMLRRVD